MKGKKIIICLLAISVIFIVGFYFIKNKNNETLDSMKKFNTEQEALQHAKQESPYITDFIDETKEIDNEKVVIYTFEKNKQMGIGTGTLAWKDKKVTWVKNGNDIVIDSKNNKADISGDVKSYSGKKYKLYAGVKKTKNLKIETQTDDNVTPHVDKKSGIYYLLIPSIN
ncbi:hypothetical protein [Bacillus tequilensis]|uniref:Uncharacterized protein n=1 Tax=Bacillus tequilensis TaxID=227866 RepID=A0A6H0WEU6_9BACI|nr:hypothetical protein [Bacillus tequilensis]QIW79060.1 hypothetical protein G4P54_04170 [Bacillus tequilensis]